MDLFRSRFLFPFFSSLEMDSELVILANKDSILFAMDFFIGRSIFSIYIKKDAKTP